MKHQKNVERLISRCESALSGKNTFSGQEWKLPRYVTALEKQLVELKKQPNIDPDLLKSYQQKVSVLREVLRNEEEPQGLFSTTSANTSYHSNVHSPNQSYVQSSSPLSSSMNVPRSAQGNELLMKANSKKLSVLREQLFSKESSSGTSLKLRQVRGEEELVRHHEDLQGEVAEDMIEMARSLKSNATLAKTIITTDNERLKKTTTSAEKNIESVVQNTDKLKVHNRGCNWGIWIILLLVFITFIAMVLFIRIFPKPR